jgi:hypothetical protein
MKQDKGDRREMPNKRIYPFVIVCLIIISLVDLGLFSQSTRIYRHPILNIEFEASGNWYHVVRPEDSLIYEMVDGDSLIHVVLWYTETEQSAPDYLWKMANMKDLVLEEKPSEIHVNNYSGWILRVSGYEENVSIRTFLTVIPRGKSKTNLEENSLYIVYIWCPAKYFPQKREIMERILDSIEIKDKQ